MAIITLTTDFGHGDHYVACMKGVILRIAPKVNIVDVSHEVAPHDILHGAFILRQLIQWFPDGTIHVVVVDPGVGTGRRIIVARYADHYVIAPDNGLISLAHQLGQFREARILQNPRFMLPMVSNTFHGRDIMAPAAAHLAAGGKMRDVGPPADRVEMLQVARPQLGQDGNLTGQVIHADCFGNLITNIGPADMAAATRHQANPQVYLMGQCVGSLHKTYSNVGAGQPLALFGSSDLLEISINCGSAAEHFGQGVNASVEVK